nr:MAG: baculoviral IAP repeat-containing protein [Penaeus semisulcatus pemonivirus]
MPRTFFNPDYSLRFECLRLETFIKWPHDWLDPSTLAKDGFYYMLKKDHCACAFCGGIIGKWETGDTPREEHMRHFPKCPFLRGEPVGNVPIPLEDSIYRLRRQLPSYPSVKLHGIYPFSEIPEYECSRYERYATYKERLESFSNWPLNINQKKNDLADAGYYYYGIRDHVRCFHCGGGLREWEADDNPWIEHARWYPFCNFVILTKGELFIREALNIESSRTNVKNVINNAIDSLMELDITKAVIELEYPLKNIKDALYEYVWANGTVFRSVENCIRHVLISISRGKLPPRPENIEDEPFPPLPEIITGNIEANNHHSRLPEIITGNVEAEPSDNASDDNDDNDSDSHASDPNFAISKKDISSEVAVSPRESKAIEEEERIYVSEKLWNLPECKVCLERETCIIFLPCHHMVTCTCCALHLTHCPVCRCLIVKAIKPYI